MGLPELIVNISSQVVKVVKHILLLLMGSRQAWDEVRYYIRRYVELPEERVSARACRP